MLKTLRGLLARLRRSADPPPPPTVDVGADGFALRQGDREIAAIRWDQVTRVVTYKRDNFVTDEIMLVFDYTDDGGAPMHLPVSEEWRGFTDLFPVLPERFPGLSPGWYEQVMLPAFEPNYTVLYDRSATPADPEPV